MEICSGPVYVLFTASSSSLKLEHYPYGGMEELSGVADKLATCNVDLLRKIDDVERFFLRSKSESTFRFTILVEVSPKAKFFETLAGDL